MMMLVKFDLILSGLFVVFGINCFVFVYFFDVVGVVSFDVLINEWFKFVFWVDVNVGWFYEMIFGVFFWKFFFVFFSCVGSGCFYVVVCGWQIVVFDGVREVEVMYSVIVIKNQVGIFFGCSLQFVVQCLQLVNFIFCWMGVDNVVNIIIKIGYQYIYIDDYFCGVSFEVVDYCLLFFVGCFCDYYFSVNVCFVKLYGYKVCVGFVNVECYCRKVMIMMKLVIDDIVYQVRIVYDFCQLGFVVISIEFYRWFCFYFVKIWFCWGEKFVFIEVIMLD